jgi:hypothetical protein
MRGYGPLADADSPGLAFGFRSEISARSTGLLVGRVHRLLCAPSRAPPGGGSAVHRPRRPVRPASLPPRPGVGQEVPDI